MFSLLKLLCPQDLSPCLLEWIGWLVLPCGWEEYLLSLMLTSKEKEISARQEEIEYLFGHI